ncbi:MAG: GNAT family N-acetyltransferase [Thiocapsa sp.]|uniref:GNAT family N-acetyltransferase n=1 Tax=Thiocapsa sp. TaxID=2024551 RepID=UPI001BCC8024|nr:GNAT family N-acetyltransferase [Thiocapsa sp.]QVL47611.1 MAG: GNAT family N-acetyltransferase [Thiocapsa sp.]
MSALTSSERHRLRILTDGTGDSHMLAVLREHPKQALCFLARSEFEILGWSLVRWFKPFCERPRNAHLSVFVAPEWRRYGLGRALIEEAVQFAVTHGLTAWVYAGGSDQRDFYLRCPSVEHISDTLSNALNKPSCRKPSPSTKPDPPRSNAPLPAPTERQRNPSSPRQAHRTETRQGGGLEDGFRCALPVVWFGCRWV